MSNQRKIFSRNYILPIAFIVFAVYDIYQYIKMFNIYWNDIHYSSWTLYGPRICIDYAIFFFIIMLCISYEYIYSNNKDGLLDIASMYGYKKGIANQIMLLMIYNCIFTLINIIGTIAVTVVGPRTTGEIAMQTMENIFVYSFLCGILAVVLGALIGHIRSRLKGVCLIITVMILVSPVTYMICSAFDSAKFNAFIIDDFISVLPSHTDYAVNDMLGMYIIPSDICVILLWITVFTTCLLCIYTKHKKRVYIFTSIIIVICSSVILFRPAGNGYDGYSRSMFHHYSYYEGKVEEKPADFAVTAYDMDIDVRYKLDAKVTMTVDKKDLEMYSFTLYHQYKVSRVYDQNGYNLDYNVDSDWLYVVGNDDIESITVEYKGESGNFYSFCDGTSLMGFFPYYPQTGIRNIYDDEINSYTQKEPEVAADYIVDIKSFKTIYSNLEESDTQSGHFEGKAHSVCLYGAYLKKLIVDDITVVYPYAGIFGEDNVKNIESGIEKLLELEASGDYYYTIHGKTIFIGSGNSVPDYTFMKEYGYMYLLTEQSSIDRYYQHFLDTGENVDTSYFFRQEYENQNQK